MSVGVSMYSSSRFFREEEIDHTTGSRHTAHMIIRATLIPTVLGRNCRLKVLANEAISTLLLQWHH